ncbi:putative phage abortive infection protein [Paenibacillus septentrionalis]|uniref:Phage abortive infection protein n=1 Tax=Paenibacillus septentrionalis TaxID=429342 RepID=A0ABW1V4I6_9BACL
MNIFDTRTIVNVILVTFLASVLLALPFKWFNSSTDKQYWYQRKENWWIIAGFVIAVGAVSIPFVLMYAIDTNIAEILKQSSDEQGKSVDYLSILASTGDFLGGTTVGLLSLASIIFVTAAIFMQKEELELQRKELKDTRKEYEITNDTMIKQQFETTFFNLIDIHHKILNDIEENGERGRKAIKIYLEKIRSHYDETTVEKYKNEIIQEMISSDNLEDILELIWFNHRGNNNKISMVKNEITRIRNEYELEKLTDQEFETKINSLYDEMSVIENAEKGKLKDKLLDEKVKKYQVLNLKHIWKSLVDNLPDNVFIKKFLMDTYSEPKYILKKDAFEAIYVPKEPYIGHYLRNIYHIFKLIENSNATKKEEDKRKYRSLLRAQFSSVELLFIFYNINYSSKGEKFKELISSTNFFDDHLDNAERIWKNDLFEIKKLN